MQQVQKEEEVAARKQARIDSGEEVIVGVNRYELDEEEGRAKLRRSSDITAFAQSVIKQSALLPSGVLVDGFTVDPAALSWLAEETLA